MGIAILITDFCILTNVTIPITLTTTSTEAGLDLMEVSAIINLHPRYFFNKVNICKSLEHCDTDTMSDIESNIPQIANQIFSAPPQPPFSIQIGIDAGNINSSENDQYILEIMMNMLVEGCKTRYGEGQDLAKLSPQQMGTLQEYFRSFGWKIIVSTHSSEEFHQLPQARMTSSAKPKSDEGYTPQDLEYYEMRVMDKERDVYHTVKFEILDTP